tara:strand:- start:204 stop:440 length:237 start_codon:yes stop_codon:yes gene_type:complete
MKKYLVIEHHKFKTFNDTWTIKFADVDEDTAFTKMVALRTLNEDKDKIYYIVNMEYLWTKDKLNDNLVKEDNQEELPF